MGEPTTLTLDSDVKEELEKNYRHEKHHSWTQWAEGLIKMLPEVDEYECANCGDEPFSSGPTEEFGGVVRWTKVDYEDDVLWMNNWFCSTHCAHELDEEMASFVPEEPDNVIIGGKDELRTEFGSATFYMDREQMEVGIPVPGAFAGTDSHGGEYQYVGEPVFIENEGRIVQKGVIEDIIHEETHTALILRQDYANVMEYHPDEETREEYLENKVEWYNRDCPECSEELNICESWEGDYDGEIKCHNCDTELSITEDREVLVV